MNGTCPAVPVYSGVTGLRGVTVNGSQLFYTTSAGLYRGTTSGGAPTQIATAGGSSKFAVATDDTYVYWAGSGDGNVYRTPMNVTPPATPTTVIDTTCTNLATIALDATNVYAGCFPTGIIVTAPKTASMSPGTATADTGHVGVMVGYVQDAFLYFGYETGQGKSGVYKISTLLTGPVFEAYDTMPSTQGIDALVFDGKNVYWTDAYGADLTRALPDGSARLSMRPAQTPGDLAGGIGVNAAGSSDPYVYVTLMGSNTIAKIAK